MTPSQTHASGPGTLTNDIYYASLPPAVAALQKGSTTGKFAGRPYAWLVSWAYYERLPDGTVLQYGAESLAAASALLAAAQLTGWPIDQWIQLWNNDPVKSMDIRVNAQHLPYGPPYGSANADNPNDPIPNVPNNFPATMPAGWILYSTDAKDYPPFPVAPVVPPTVMYTVGPFQKSAVGTDNLLHYYYGVVSGQRPPIDTVVTQTVPGVGPANFIADDLVDNSLMGGGAMQRLWRLQGLATGGTGAAG